MAKFFLWSYYFFHITISAPKLQSQKQVAALDDAFGALDMNVCPAPQTSEAPRPEACSLAPKWFGKRVGAKFGFGGKLVQWVRALKMFY